jgi:pyruvate/2-oxoglutarate dehydrogenase complex dihydrolipoamide dehydrogenase (E3) component
LTEAARARVWRRHTWRGPSTFPGREARAVDGTTSRRQPGDRRDGGDRRQRRSTLVATGRRPDQEAWRATGLAQTERGWLKVDPATLEARAGVFGAGDVTGLGGFTHVAYYHGQVIARRLRGMNATADHTAIRRVTFTDPEVASVGLSELAARAKGIDVAVTSADPAETARGYIHDFHGGALKLIADRKRGVPTRNPLPNAKSASSRHPRFW